MSTSPVAGQTSASRATERSAAWKSDRDATVSVVIPVYEEVGNIRPLFDELQEMAGKDGMADWRPVEIIWVEDESEDGTAEVVDELASDHDHVTAIHLRRGWGQSAALAAGMEASSGDVVVPMDGDRQNDPADIPRLLATLANGYDCVSGWRRSRDDPLGKRIPSAIQTRLAKHTGPDIHDFGCTLTAYRREALEAVDLRGETHRYIPAQLYDKGYSVTELEVNHRPRTEGESRYGIGRLVRGFVDLLFHWFWVRYGSRPMHLLGGTGLVLGGLGGILGAWTVGQWLIGLSLANHPGRLVLIAILVQTGALFLVFGVLAEMLTKLHHNHDREYRIQRIVD